MGPEDLSTALAPLARHADPRLLVGPDTFDDAAVVRLHDDLALVQTVDFFAPVVDDPYDFGRIAAANALSDVYAMGGRPLSALALAAFPEHALPLSVLSDILRGGEDVVRAAGAMVVGGHTVTDDEVKYGLAVTGTIDPARMMTNANAQPGDALVLTKPLGTGLLATKMKSGTLAPDEGAALIASMVQLNAQAATEALRVGVRAATDITGFGLLGHASHMARASGVTLRVHADALPMLPGAEAAARDGVTTGGAARNAHYVEPLTAWASRVTIAARIVLCDPQTSGGLLVAVPRARLDEYLAAVPGAVCIGEVLARQDAALIVD
jgi:selenide, water dikinase